MLTAELERASGSEDFYGRLLGRGLKLYRRGRSVGVAEDSGRKFRLKTLGLAETFEKALVRWRRLSKDLQQSKVSDLELDRSRDGPELER